MIEEIVERLAGIEGIVAITLGGSRARGREGPGSDFDLGLHYREASPFSIRRIKEVAEDVHDGREPAVTDFGRWGRWVDGGAWLTVGGQRVDFLYRNLDGLERVIEDCRRGTIVSDYYQQPPYGFHSYIYLGEVHLARVLYDPEGIIERLKLRVARYPSELKTAIINRFLWEAEFDLQHAGTFAGRGDVYGTAGCLTRCGAALVQVLFALNERYFVGDKGALEELEGFDASPDDFVSALTDVLARPGRTSANLAEGTGKMGRLLRRVTDLCGELCSQPDFQA